MKKTLLASALFATLFYSCKKCEVCTTNEVVTVSGDSSASPRITTITEELCGTDRKEVDDKEKVIETTQGNVKVRIVKSTTCANQ